MGEGIWVGEEVEAGGIIGRGGRRGLGMISACKGGEGVGERKKKCERRRERKREGEEALD